MAIIFDQEREKPTNLSRGRDTKSVRDFDTILESQGMSVKPVGVSAPNQYAVAERFVRIVKPECLDQLVVFGETHLRHVTSEYLVYYCRFCPHEGLDTRRLGWTELASADRPLNEVVCQKCLDGLPRHNERSAD